MSLSAFCSEPNVIFLEATCDSRSVIHQDDQIGEALPGLWNRKLCCVQIKGLPANISSSSPFTSEYLGFFLSDMTKESIKSYFIFFLFTAAPVAYGSFWARGQIGNTAVAYATVTAMQHLSHICNLNPAYGNEGSLTH